MMTRDWRPWWQRLKTRVVSSRTPHALYLFDPSDQSARYEAAQDAFGAWCGANPGAVCRVGLSSRWLLYSVVPSKLKPDEARARARQQWAHYLDMEAAELDETWVMRDVQVCGARLVCAAPRALVEALQTHAKAHGVDVAWMGPWWVHAVQNWLDASQDDVTRTGDAVLHLAEPRWQTQVELSMPSSEAPCLQRVWVERSHQEHAWRPSGAHLSICSLVDASQADANHPQGLWAHEPLRQLLRSDPSVWQGAV